jgi:hypothetical protein
VAQHGGRVEPDLRATSRRAGIAPRLAVVAEHFVQRRLDVRIAKPLDDDAVDDRKHAVHGLRALDAHDDSDPDRRVERGPEMELVRRVGLALSGDYAAEN